jgi:hypothetical protein
MARALSLVRQTAEGASVPATMAEAARDMLSIILAEDPAVMTFIWEPAGETGKVDPPIRMSSLPPARSVLEGQIGRAAEVVFPTPKSSDD